MGIMGILLLVCGALAGLAGLRGLDMPKVEDNAQRKAQTGSGDVLGGGKDTAVAGSLDPVAIGPGTKRFALGDWTLGDAPVEFADFDAAEDIITFIYDRDGTAPDFSVERNEATGATTIKANGHAIAVLHDASPAFSMRNIGVGRYAA